MSKKAEVRIVVSLTNIAICFWRGWLLMLIVGIVHSQWWPAVPTIGYWWAVLLIAIFPAGGYTTRDYFADEDARDRLKRKPNVDALVQALSGRR